MADEQIQVVDKPAELRYELWVNGAQAGSAEQADLVVRDPSAGD